MIHVFSIYAIWWATFNNFPAFLWGVVRGWGKDVRDQEAAESVIPNVCTKWSKTRLFHDFMGHAWIVHVEMSKFSITKWFFFFFFFFWRIEIHIKEINLLYRGHNWSFFRSGLKDYFWTVSMLISYQCGPVCKISWKN